MKDITIGTVEDASLTARIATVEMAMTTSGLVVIEEVTRLYDHLPIRDRVAISEWSAEDECPVVRDSGPLWQTLLDLLQNDRCDDGIFQQIKVGILVEPQPAGGFSRFDVLSDIGWLGI
jgi:hypothetical protein